LDFTNTVNPSYSEGRVFYDNNEKTLAVYNCASDVIHQLGQEHLIRVKNETGIPIINGQVVRLIGATTNGYYFPLIAPAQADTLDNSINILGVATETIADGDFGFVTAKGKVHGLNTLGFNVGDKLYLSSTVSGGWDTPIPNIIFVVGYVLNVSETEGAILVSFTDLSSLQKYSGITYASDETESTTTSLSFQQKLRMSYTPLALGDYIIEWTAEIATNSNNKGCEVRLEQDDTTELNIALNAPIVAGAYITASGFKMITFSDLNTHTFDIDFRAEAASTTAKVRRVRIQIRKC